MDITKDQIRASRVLLRWSAKDLANESGVAESTVLRIEKEESAEDFEKRIVSVRQIQAALEHAGIVFLPATERHQATVALRRED